MRRDGRVRLKATDSKSVVPLAVPGVRIPLSPPFFMSQPLTHQPNPSQSTNPGQAPFSGFLLCNVVFLIYSTFHHCQEKEPTETNRSWEGEGIAMKRRVLVVVVLAVLLSNIMGCLPICFESEHGTFQFCWFLTPFDFLWLFEAAADGPANELMLMELDCSLLE